MSKINVAAVILAAGKGTRMSSELPKVLQPLAGRPMIGHLLATLETLAPARAAVVIGPDMEAVAEAVAPWPTVIQQRQLGTGHAVLAARGLLEGFTGAVLVLYGDTPLVSRATLARMLERLRGEPRPAVVVLGFHPREAGGYGRLVTGPGGVLEAIVEAADASPAERKIGLCNSGVMAIDGARLLPLLESIGSDNAKGEFYLTDIVALARREGADCAYVEAPAEELIGINSRAELAAAEAVVQRALRERAMAEGATLTAPETVWLCHDTAIGRDVTIGPNVIFGPGVELADGVEIRGFCHIEGAHIGPGAVVGPFARLRPGARIGREVHIGNFVEIKNATLDEGVKANHLSYLGDAHIGSGANIGAGTITCNYDGFDKHHTEIGAEAFIGSNTALVAPVKVGKGAFVGAGSVITRDVPADALALERARQGEIPDWATAFRAQKRAERAAKAKGAKPVLAKSGVAKSGAAKAKPSHNTRPGNGKASAGKTSKG
jgi:bifunctional UDP-N-acetylglucosamine pyrophosphorylase / glucosamine-1-phosphate N-acetyltransferase